MPAARGGRKSGVAWEGVLANVERRYDETGSDAVRARACRST